MIVACVLIYAYAPEEKTMGIVQKVFYWHVPVAWISFLAFLFIFVSSIIFLSGGKPIWDTIALSSAEIGIIFNTLMLITGMIWAKSVWGVWWTWDSRLTSSLVLWFIYVGYLLVRHSGLDPERSAKFASVIGILGFADVPIVALAITLWRTQHPADLIFKGGLSGPMLVTLIVSIIAFTLFFMLLLISNIYRHKLESIVAELKSLIDPEKEEE